MPQLTTDEVFLLAQIIPYVLRLFREIMQAADMFKITFTDPWSLLHSKLCSL